MMTSNKHILNEMYLSQQKSDKYCDVIPVGFGETKFEELLCRGRYHLQKHKREPSYGGETDISDPPIIEPYISQMFLINKDIFTVSSEPGCDRPGSSLNLEGFTTLSTALYLHKMLSPKYFVLVVDITDQDISTLLVPFSIPKNFSDRDFTDVISFAQVGVHFKKYGEGYILEEIVEKRPVVWELDDFMRRSVSKKLGLVMISIRDHTNSKSLYQNIVNQLAIMKGG